MLSKLLCGTAIAVGVISGCKSSESSSRVLVEPKLTRLFSVDATDKFDDASTYYQPSGSENVYIFNKNSGTVFRLGSVTRSLELITSVPVVQDPNAELAGFTVEEQLQRIRMFYTDMVIEYSFNGRQTNKIAFSGLSSEGFIYPLAKSFLPIFKRGKMYAPFYPATKDAVKNPRYFSSPVEAAVDLKSGKVTFLPQTYPSDYLANCYSYGTEPFRMAVRDDQHAYFFPQNDSVYLRDLKTGELQVKFFGSRISKSFEFIPYDKINSINASAFDELSLNNPFYTVTYDFPLAGYFGRTLILTPDEKYKSYRQYVVLTDREFNYQLEMKYPQALLIDSKTGILAMECSNGKLTVSKLSW